jgi:hypothetical protein
MKIKGLDRRNFLKKSSLILGSLGISSYLKMEMLEDLSKMILPSAEAAPVMGGRINYCLEILAPGGYPLHEIFGTKGFTLNNIGRYVNHHDPSNIILAKNLFLSRRSDALARHADNIAYSNSIVDTNDHIPVPSVRMGGVVMSRTENIPTKAPASPSILFANTGVQNTLMGGVNLFGNFTGAMNSLNGYADFPRIETKDDFIALFQKPSIRATQQEVLAITETVKKLNKNMAESLLSRINKVDDAETLSSQSSKTLVTDYATLVSARLTQLKNERKFAIPSPIVPKGDRFAIDPDFGDTLSMAIAGFENSLFKSANIYLSTGDWHGRSNPRGEEGLQCQSAMYISRQLATAIDYMKAI